MTEDNKNDGRPKATLTLLEIPETLKLKVSEELHMEDLHVY